MITADTEQKIAAIDYELSELEIYIRRCRNSLERLKRAGEQEPLPQTLEDPEEFQIAVNMIDAFSDEIYCFSNTLNKD